MRRYRVRFSPAAENDLEELEAFVAEASGWVRADLVTSAVTTTADNLAQNPGRGSKVRGARHGERWVLTDKGTQIVYRIDEAAGQVLVTLIAHRGRSLKRLLKDRP
jgi:plasmid stabilization system protein ParE